MPSGPKEPEGPRGTTSSAPKHMPGMEEGPSRRTASKKKKASKDKRAPPSIFLEGDNKRWKALPGIRANDSISYLKTVMEYTYHMFTLRDISSIRDRKYSAERLQKEGMRNLLEV